MNIKLIGFFFTVFYSFNGQSFCPSGGVDLSQNGSYSHMTPSNQGEIGTCYAHSFVNLLSSQLGLRQGISIVDVSMTEDRHNIDSGSVNEVFENLRRRPGECHEYVNGRKTGRVLTGTGYACTSSTGFDNLFRSSDKNIISDLSNITRSLPVQYSLESDKSKYKKEVAPIFEKIKILAKNKYKSPEECTNDKRLSTIDNELEKLNQDLNSISKRVVTFNQKNTVMGETLVSLDRRKLKLNIDPYLMVSAEQENSLLKINTDFESLKKNILPLREEKTKIEEKKSSRNTLVLFAAEESKTTWNKIVDYHKKYGPEFAAEVLLKITNDFWPKIEEVLTQYGIDKRYFPTQEEFIIQAGENPGSGGPVYISKLINNYIQDACGVESRVCLPQGSKLNNFNGNRNEIKNKVGELLSQKKGIGITINSKLLQNSSSGNAHAVNIVGCRDNQVLIYNSWGTDCTIYKSDAVKGCKNGMIWLDADKVFHSMEYFGNMDPKGFVWF